MDRVHRNINHLRELLHQPKSGKTEFRRLSALEDSEGKTRLVAIGDYWSQTCLKPLHDKLYRVLRTIPQDQTFNQGEGLRGLPLDGSYTYYSFDLSAATDRFPIDIINWFLEHNFGENISIAWNDVMVGYPFCFKTPKGADREYYYSVGNPMGFYSSWATFAIMHHFIIYCACREINTSWKQARYKLLGDDIVIYDDLLASKYKDLITSLGVEISESKTHESKIFFEFAKRYFVPSGEISPFSIKAALQESKSFMAFRQLLDNQREKGWIPIISCQDALLDFYRTRPNPYRAKTRSEQIRKIEETDALYKRLKGFTSDLRLINTVLVTKGLPSLSCNQEHVAKAMFNGCIVQAFEKSASEFTGDIHDRLCNSIMFATSSPDESYVDLLNSIYDHPYSFIVGQFVEQSYIDSMKKAYDFDTLYNGE